MFKLFGIFWCIGQVYPPSNKNITVLPGSTARLKWTFQGDSSQAILVWYFTRRKHGPKEEELAVKFRSSDATPSNSSLPGVAIEPPATLVLKNVDEHYNGKYRLSVHLAGAGGTAQVDLYIAGMF